MADTDTFARGQVTRYDGLKSARANNEATWRSIRRLYFPNGVSFENTVRTQGQRDRRATVDSTAKLANKELAGVLTSALANPTQKWFGIEQDGRDQDETTDGDPLMEQVQKHLMKNVFANPKTQFGPSFFESLLEAGGYGTGFLYHGDRPGKPQIFFPTPIAQTVFDRDEDMVIDTVQWRCEFTARQAVQKFGNDAGEAVVSAANDANRMNDKFRFQHCMIPRPDYDPASFGPRGMRYISAWINVDAQLTVMRSGFHEPCYHAFEWERQPGEMYATGPADDALEDTRMMQRARVGQIRGVEKAIDPPYMVPDDGVVTRPTQEPRGMIVVRADMMLNNQAPIRQLPVTGRPELAIEFIQDIRSIVERAFLKEHTQLPRDPRLLRDQVLGLQEEQLSFLAPIIGRFQRALAGVVERAAMIEYRRGRLPLDREQLAGTKWSVTFVSPLAKAMQLSEARAIKQTIDFVLPIAAVDPEVLSVFKLPEMARRFGRIVGMPLDLFHSADEHKKIQDQTMRAVEERENQEGAKNYGVAAEKGAKAMQALSLVGGTDKEAA